MPIPKGVDVERIVTNSVVAEHEQAAISEIATAKLRYKEAIDQKARALIEKLGKRYGFPLERNALLSPAIVLGTHNTECGPVRVVGKVTYDISAACTVVDIGILFNSHEAEPPHDNFFIGWLVDHNYVVGMECATLLSSVLDDNGREKVAPLNSLISLDETLDSIEASAFDPVLNPTPQATAAF